MKLYLLTQDIVTGYDTYSAAVVIAATPFAARRIHPADGQPVEGNRYGGWCTNHDNVRVVCLGDAEPGLEAGVVCASYNAG